MYVLSCLYLATAMYEFYRNPCFRPSGLFGLGSASVLMCLHWLKDRTNTSGSIKVFVGTLTTATAASWIYCRVMQRRQDVKYELPPDVRMVMEQQKIQNIKRMEQQASEQIQNQNPEQNKNQTKK